MFCHFFCYFRDAAKHAASHATEHKNSIEPGTQNATKKHHFYIFFTSRAATLTKPQKMTSRSVPGPSPGGGKGSKIDPKAAKRAPRRPQERPKTAADDGRRRTFSFPRPCPSRPGAQEVPRGLREPILDLPGPEKRPPGNPFGVDFQSPQKPISAVGGATPVPHLFQHLVSKQVFISIFYEMLTKTSFERGF